MEGIELALKDILEELKTFNHEAVRISQALRNIEAAVGDLYQSNLPKLSDIKLPQEFPYKARIYNPTLKTDQES